MLSVCNLDHLTVGTRNQYKRAFRWLRREYGGAYDRTEPLQAFVNENPSCKGIRGRIVQCLVNRHLSPKPVGPPITIMRAIIPPSGNNKGKMEAQGEVSWEIYLPLHLRHRILSSHSTSDWNGWWRHYIVYTLAASPLKQNLVRAYVTHVYRVLWEDLACTSLQDFVALQRQQLVQSILTCNPVRVHQRRLCRIAVNHFIADTVLRDYPVLAQRLHLWSRDFKQPRVLPSHGGGGGGDHPADVVINRPGHTRDHFTQAEMDTLLTLPGPGFCLEGSHRSLAGSLGARSTCDTDHGRDRPSSACSQLASGRQCV